MIGKKYTIDSVYVTDRTSSGRTSKLEKLVLVVSVEDAFEDVSGQLS